MAKLTSDDFNVLFQELSSHSLTQNQCNQLMGVLHKNRRRLARLMRYTLVPGDRVQWTGKYGKSTGVLQRVLRKNGQVTSDADGCTWRVPLTILERVQ